MHVLFSVFIILHPTFFSAQSNNRTCLDTVIDNQSVVYQRMQADLDKNGFVEELAIYSPQKDRTATNTTPELRFLLTGYNSQGVCLVYINSSLTYAHPNQLEIHTLESIELTGSNPPEIHLAYNVDRQSKRSSQASHHIFSYVNNSWEEVFVVGNCLHMNYFEFQDNSQTQTADIYTENDPYCDDSWPSQYAGYTLFSWDGEKFTFVEEGNQHHFLPAISIWEKLSVFSPYIILCGLLLSAFAFGFLRQLSKSKQRVLQTEH